MANGGPWGPTAQIMAAELRPRCGQTIGPLTTFSGYVTLTTNRLGNPKRAAGGSVIYPDLAGFRSEFPATKKGVWEAGMVQAAVRGEEGVAPGSAVLDRAHLARMTFNDQGLEREILQLFDRQAELLIERMRGSEPAAVATLAHTLKGSAVGIGARRVAVAAAAAERAASSAPGECSCAIDQLAQAVDEVRIEIAALRSVR